MAAGGAGERGAEGDARKTTETSEGAPTCQAEVSETGKLTHGNINFSKPNRAGRRNHPVSLVLRPWGDYHPECTL